MNNYTVVLMRGYRFEDIPGWDAEPETDCYVALVEAEDTVQAVIAARKQAIAADVESLTRSYGKHFAPAMRLDLHDYTFIVLFEGHQDAKLFGFQTGLWQL